MKKTIILIAAIAISFAADAQKFSTLTGKITFFSTTPVENIEAVNNEVGSVIDAATGKVVFNVAIKGFRFDKALMQEHFNENYLESDKYPNAKFDGQITNLGNVNFSKDGVYNAKVSGKLTIHGVTKDVSIPGTVTVRAGKIIANTKFNVKIADYKVKRLSPKVAEEIEVTVNTELAKKG